jgi:hypothetical protein
MALRLLLGIAVVGLLAACGGSVEATTTMPQGTLAGQALAGPTCPVETTPPDPACAPRPVPGAVLLVLDAGDERVAEIITDDEGRFSAAIAAGSYRLVPQPVEGLMGTAEPQDVTIEAGETTTVVVGYDTGIR